MVIGLSLSCFVVSSNTGNNDACIEIERTIKESMKFTVVTSTGTQKVEVLFTTNTNGNVNFVLVKTKDALLKGEIEKQFYSKHFTGLNTDVVNSVTLTFKTL
ncbi:MAG: hypothetical protein K0S32_3123 [Bacteroidetes bacterium]|jgi:hypothetical protein|nr:hypothetical protein [Bacteroidota bacterium]